MRPAVWTIGHSNRTPEEFVALLTSNGIEAIADVRRYPASRRSPHVASTALAACLPSHGIAYLPMPELGGRRTPLPDSCTDS